MVLPRFPQAIGARQLPRPYPYQAMDAADGTYVARQINTPRHESPPLFEFGAQRQQQAFYFRPLDTARDRVLENQGKGLGVLALHGGKDSLAWPYLQSN